MAIKTITNRNLGGLSLAGAFDDFFRPLIDNTVWNKTFTIPAVNITESDGAYKLSLAVPGINKDNLSIDIEGNKLTISAETEEDTEDTNEDYTRREYNYSSFSRSFTIPDEVDSASIQAEYQDGVLSIVLPKYTNNTKSTQSIPIK